VGARGGLVEGRLRHHAVGVPEEQLQTVGGRGVCTARPCGCCSMILQTALS
jgi:hypothetical protein